MSRELFGGAMAMRIPADFIDARFVSIAFYPIEFRQVPDNQEVYVHKNSEDSLIVELVEMLPGKDLVCLREHFDEIAECNQAEQVKTIEPKQLPLLKGISDPHSVLAITGTMVMGKRQRKMNESSQYPSDSKLAAVLLVLVRLPVRSTDLLITCNCPFDQPNVDSVDLWAKFNSFISDSISSLEIRDWTLFG
ncbi:hypothetical protein BB560_004738 [Smittium megazygosporum]|uniref:Ran guanine nucleotide release factor n=1 Tax=Smittium megazygosporum TaxID=133381 RepID=A0A2T9Z8E5_9FUNG|nr:hypothetical protein BB560_004738 [Smittium megazygosporum]